MGETITSSIDARPDVARLEVLVKTGKNLIKASSGLGERLDQHVRHEERTVFKQIQDALSEHEMENLGKYLNLPGGK